MQATGQISCIPFKLACPFLPTMMWSCTEMPSGDLDDRLGHMDIGLRERRIAGGMVVHHQIARPIALKVFGFYDVVAIIGG